MGVITRHFIYGLLLWYFDDNWQVSSESTIISERDVASNLEVVPVVEQDMDENEQDDATMDNATEQAGITKSFPRTIHIAPAAAQALTPALAKRLACEHFHPNLH